MCNVTVHVTGTCDGRVFEDRDVTFIIGCGSEAGIVPGVEMALKKFHRGEKSRLKVSANYGYGSEGCLAYDIAAGAELTYEVKMRQFVRVRLSTFIIVTQLKLVLQQYNLHFVVVEVFSSELIAC